MDHSWQDTLVHASRPVRFAATAALGMLALFLLISAINGLHNWGQPNTPPTNTITVTGEGQATAIPDTALITFSVIETGTDVAGAQAAATKLTSSALAAVKKEGVKDIDVRTTSYDVSPQYEQARPCYAGAICNGTGNPNAIVGYQVSETIEVKVHDLTKTGAVLTDLGTLGVQNIQGPQLTVADETAVQAQARGDAITKARADAQKLATQLGAHLGKVVSFSENSGGRPQPIYAMGAKMDAAVVSAPAVPVATGQNEYTDTVSITYEIN